MFTAAATTVGEGSRQRAGRRVGVEHDRDCVVPRPAARLLSPRAALKQLDELELARHPPHPAAPQSSSNVIPFRRTTCGVPS
jgi:hypothetical protein